ncbi:DUF1697 domain-containing protein [Winogradskyella luteola]|uniref:DUF1697 domain-containing protein n=1 Tax=Winogradskyella luteola TaxID=2828330 RepID=A0A9X1F8Y6_9FLAO|nr:DUF1697 domain-containing protein [Winogradskyella luteola]MBV7269520.1 DUF1697 domain-containing protein [Winogradskyella luteola]
MNTYIALLRGINVGGHKKVPMAELRELLTSFGLKNVKTYIQSGNVIFQSLGNDNKALEKQIKQSILDHFGFDVSVLVKTRAQLKKIFDDCPFSEEKKVNSYFAVLTEIPNEDLVLEACKKTYENEEYKILNNCLYFYCANGYGKAKFNLNFFERKLNVNATSRNYNTLNKLLGMSE